VVHDHEAKPAQFQVIATEHGSMTDVLWRARVAVPQTIRTRQRIPQIATDLGYMPDARIASVTATVRPALLFPNGRID
jgi:hypothetical protein